MLRVEATLRATKHEGRQVYDIFHVWPDKHINRNDGVIWTSNIFVYLAEPTFSFKDNPNVNKPARVRIWAPGGIAGERRDLHWGEELWLASKGFGIVSVICDDDVPLHVFWELSAGKA